MTGEKITVTPDVGHELFKLGMLTDKVPQFHLLATGNPRPETTAVSPLYQITVDVIATRIFTDKAHNRNPVTICVHLRLQNN